MTLRGSTSPLRIHISHPLGRSSKAVHNLADALGGLGSGAVVASCTGKLALDQHWPTRAGEVLRSAHWLLVIFGDRSLDRDWWLWEAGYFAAINPVAASRTICLHHPDLNVPRTLHAWRTVPATNAQADGLVREILDSQPNSGGRSLLSSIEGKGHRALIEFLVNCCMPARSEPMTDPAHAITTSV